jgi:hypothetical protein
MTSSVTVTPDTFQFVTFDAEVIRRVADELVAALGIDRPVHVEVDETTPLAKVRVDIAEQILVHVDSGAFEDARRPRHQSEVATSVSIGRALLRARDRLHGGFGEAPADTDLSLRQVSAWETYCVGRLNRLGITVNQQRWRYNFRNRHGFTDQADHAFDTIWNSEALTWGELESLSATASVTVPPYRG